MFYQSGRLVIDCFISFTAWRATTLCNQLTPSLHTVKGSVRLAAKVVPSLNKSFNKDGTTGEQDGEKWFEEVWHGVSLLILSTSASMTQSNLLKGVSNRMKSKGLQKLRWYCQLCEKQCRDENGFKCHCSSESHIRRVHNFGTNQKKTVAEYSRLFEVNFVKHLQFSWVDYIYV